MHGFHVRNDTVLIGCCCVVTVTSIFIGCRHVAKVRCKPVDYHNGATCLIKRENPRSEERLTVVSLRDVPLKVRRKEAKKPLFLTRYE